MPSSTVEHVTQGKLNLCSGSLVIHIWLILNDLLFLWTSSYVLVTKSLMAKVEFLSQLSRGLFKKKTSFTHLALVFVDLQSKLKKRKKTILRDTMKEFWSVYICGNSQKNVVQGYEWNLELIFHLNRCWVIPEGKLWSLWYFFLPQEKY